MFPGDVVVWVRFLDKFGKLYDGFYYDVMCGKEAKMFPRWEEPYKKDSYVLSKLRIDAVGEKADVIDVIEVKPRGNMASVGQLLTYKEHFIEEYSPKKPVKMVLVCGEIDPNIIAIAEANKIVYSQV